MQECNSAKQPRKNKDARVRSTNILENLINGYMRFSKFIIDERFTSQSSSSKDRFLKNGSIVAVLINSWLLLVDVPV